MANNIEIEILVVLKKSREFKMLLHQSERVLLELITGEGCLGIIGRCLVAVSEDCLSDQNVSLRLNSEGLVILKMVNF